MTGDLSDTAWSCMIRTLQNTAEVFKKEPDLFLTIEARA